MKKFQPVLDIFYIILIYAWLCFNIIDFIKENPDIADKTVYTGMIDEFFDYKLGVLEYRRVYFEDERLDADNYQGNAVVNYTERDVGAYKYYDMDKVVEAALDCVEKNL